MKNTRTLVEHKIKHEKLNDKHGELYLEFIREYIASAKKEPSPRTVLKYTHGVCGVLHLIEQNDKHVTELDRESTIDLFERIKASGWSSETKSTNWRVFKTFYMWLDEVHGPLDKGATSKVFGKGKERDSGLTLTAKPPKRPTITPNDMLRLIAAEHHPCYKAFFSAMYEGAMAFIEASTLRLEDVTVHSTGYTLNVREGKNQHRLRSVELVEWSVVHMQRWLLAHPGWDSDKHEPRRNCEEDLLFVNTVGTQLTNAAANKRLGDLCSSAGIEVHLTCHILRHSRLTELGDGVMNTYQLNAVAGWSQGSDMAKRYVHSDKLNIRDRLLAHHGKVEEKRKRADEVGVACPVCTHRNVESALRCDGCGSPMTPGELLARNDLLHELAATQFGSLIDEAIKKYFEGKIKI